MTAPHDIRIAGPQDAPRIAALVAGFRDHLGAELPSDDSLARSVPPALAGDDQVFCYAVAPDGSSLGYAYVWFFSSVWAEGSEAHIEDLFVVEAARGQGVGRALLSFTLDQARRRGAGRVGLNTNERNEPAMALYRAAGFRPQTEPRWEGGREVRWLMRL